MQIILMQRQELILLQKLQVLETSLSMGRRRIGRIHQCKAHLIPGQLEQWRPSPQNSDLLR